jgi:hypothetical protein
MVTIIWLLLSEEDRLSTFFVETLACLAANITPSAWLDLCLIPPLSKFVKGFLTKFLLDIATLLSYKASESFPKLHRFFHLYPVRVRAAMLSCVVRLHILELSLPPYLSTLSHSTMIQVFNYPGSPGLVKGK